MESEVLYQREEETSFCGGIVPAEGRLSECSRACGFPHVSESVMSDGTSGEKAGDLEVLGCFQQLKLL